MHIKGNTASFGKMPLRSRPKKNAAETAGKRKIS